jgi:hypothetical protein
MQKAAQLGHPVSARGAQEEAASLGALFTHKSRICLRIRFHQIARSRPLPYGSLAVFSATERKFHDYLK